MEIKTTRPEPEDETPDSAPAPDAARYLRRKAGVKLRKSRGPLRLRALVPVVGKFAFVVALAGFLFAVFDYAYTSERFKLRSIGCIGCKQVDGAALESALRPMLPDNVLMIDLAKVRKRVEAEAWVKRAEVRRVLPGDLAIYVEERVPSVILELGGDLNLADEDGILLDRYSPKHGKLDVPVFRGLMGENVEAYRMYQEENTARVQLGRRMIDELEAASPAFTRSISEVDVSDRSNVRILLVDDTAEISLGDRDFLKRYRMLLSNVAKYHELKAEYAEISSIDLRFDGQIIYRPRRPEAAGPDALRAPSSGR